MELNLSLLKHCQLLPRPLQCVSSRRTKCIDTIKHRLHKRSLCLPVAPHFPWRSMIPERLYFPIPDEWTYAKEPIFGGILISFTGIHSLPLQQQRNSGRRRQTSAGRYLQAYPIPENTRSDDPDSPSIDRENSSHRPYFNPHVTPLVPPQGLLQGPA